MICNICHPQADRHVPTDQSKFNKMRTYSLEFYLFLGGLRVLLGGLMTIGELWDPDLAGHGVLEALEKGAQVMGEINKVGIGRGGWGVLRVDVE